MHFQLHSHSMLTCLHRLKVKYRINSFPPNAAWRNENEHYVCRARNDKQLLTFSKLLVASSNSHDLKYLLLILFRVHCSASLLTWMEYVGEHIWNKKTYALNFQMAHILRTSIDMKNYTYNFNVLNNMTINLIIKHLYVCFHWLHQNTYMRIVSGFSTLERGRWKTIEPFTN